MAAATAVTYPCLFGNKEHRMKMIACLMAAQLIVGTSACHSVRAADMDEQSPRRLAVSADGSKVAVACTDRTVRVWDAQTGKLSHALTTEQPATSVAFAGPEGNIFAGDTGMQATVYIWKPKDGKYTLASKTPVQGSVMALTASPDGQWTVAVSPYAHVYFIDLAEGKLRRTWQELGNPIADVAFTPDGKTLVTIGQTLRFWDAALEELRGDSTAGFIVSDEQRQRDERRFLRFKSGCGSAVAPLPNGEWIAAVGWFVTPGGRASDLALFESKSGGTRRILSTTMKDVTFLAGAPDSKTLAIGHDSDLVELWSLPEGKKVEIKCDGIWKLRAGAFLKDGKHLAVTNEGGNATGIIDVSTGRLDRRLTH